MEASAFLFNLLKNVKNAFEGSTLSFYSRETCVHVFSKICTRQGYVCLNAMHPCC